MVLTDPNARTQPVVDGAQPFVELSTEARQRLLFDWNDTKRDYPDACIHELFADQARATPEATAVVFEDESLTYRELDERSNQLAHYLRVRGAAPDLLVGVCLERSLLIPVALLAVLKAGAAYLPLDPEFPPDRLQLMVEDSQLRLLVTETGLLDRLPSNEAELIRMDADSDAIGRESRAPLRSDARPHHLAYVLYTSGSTGRPKGVMVEHRNVVNFFAGMDERVEHDPPGVWLAVTSLSFDISVLELLWTVTRGFKVVIQSDHDRIGSVRGHAGTAAAVAAPAMEFSLFYFAAQAEAGPGAYDLLMKGAQFADSHGFTAVWTPERHFHAFGGLYPNPSVVGAAIAATTKRIQIRAGSVVLPLHSPIRVAEEWSVVDNLSQGRVGVSVASGWMPNDFAIAPERFEDRHVLMAQGIQALRRLWRGEAVSFAGPHGDVEVSTLPRPIQQELPIWITAAGNPDTFRQAGALGANLLTHLLGQSIEEVAEKIAIYRNSWRTHGHPGNGHVTLMLHTFVGDDIDSVREAVREPLKDYLRTSADLVRLADWSFPALKGAQPTNDAEARQRLDAVAANPADMDALLDHAFERYFNTGGLFGTPESCVAIVERLKAIGADELGCLVDFGVESSVALAHLEQLDTLRMLANRTPAAAESDYSIAAQIPRHSVTHLQCTPSLAAMLLLDAPTRAALRPLHQLLLGGEGLPAPLARRLSGLISGSLVNMYGPTETTIWSSTYDVGEIDAAETTISIGRPIANTELYILDELMRPVPEGVPGELFIGGDGVVRGYLFRPELTGERFVPDPFSGRAGARLYRTGDLARYADDGNIEFLGRLDHQVKIRGHRIELGEIEAALGEHEAVHEAVVVAREDVPGDVRLVAYVVLRPPFATADVTSDLRMHLKNRLPDYMVPSNVVAMQSFPLTPNAKIDRKALPAPSSATRTAAPQIIGTPAAAAIAVRSRATLEGLTAIWARVLNVDSVGPHDNFFELGGHSLLAMQLVADLRDAFQMEIPLRALFEQPTIAGLMAAMEELPLASADAADVASALSELDGLSDDEVRALLSS